MEIYLPEWVSLGHLKTRCIFYVLMLDIENQKFHFFTKICEIRNKRRNAKSVTWIKSTIVFPFRDIWKKINYFNHVVY